MQDTITIRGNLAADPEQRRISNDVVVTSFRVGTTARHFDKTAQEWVDDDTNWFQVSAFRALGEHAFASLRKGHPVIVSGKLKLREWESASGKGMSADIEADAVGHDLRWGSTIYTRALRPEREEPAAPVEQWTAPQLQADGEEGAPAEAALATAAGTPF
ncbi:single-stranded DNA-binding protein (plasmid) [Coraliomargarita sp. W4R53]